VSTDREHEQVVRDARAAIAATQIQQALTDGAMTFTDYPTAGVAEILAGLPSPEEMDVPTSVRLPAGLHRKLRAYAEEHQTTEQMLTIPDRPISLADAVRVLSTLPSQDQHAV
jgi:hypothetical protein